jgi:hypothetical protein
MTNPVITNNDRGKVALDLRNSQPDIILDPGVAKTYLAGTIMAREVSVSKLIPFIKGGTTNENGIPKTVLVCDIVTEGGADIPVEVPTDALVRADKLVIDADGDGSNVDVVVLDGLRDYNIVSQGVTDGSSYDNQ